MNIGIVLGEQIGEAGEAAVYPGLGAVSRALEYVLVG